MTQDTIIALSTPPGVAALALLRLSGPDVRQLTDRLLEQPLAWQPQRATYRRLCHQGQFLDDAVLTYWAAPHSFTGEDTLEISCHGNPRVIGNILQAYLDLGARAARPGEFSQRAFLNDKLSLTAAEGLLDLLTAPTARALASAQAMKEGKLAESLRPARAELIDLLSHLEASLDFAEEGIEPSVGPEFRQRIAQLRRQFQDLLRTAPLGRLLREGAVVAIVGEPNVGKSSLLNALLRDDRAIVAASPGTTRDVITAECNLRGLPLRLIDTAGFRAAEDPVESEGIRRARQAAEKADLLLHVVAAPEPRLTLAPELPPDLPRLLVANKADLGVAKTLPPEAIPVSLLTGVGLDLLEEKIELALLQPSETGHVSSPLAINARQSAALKRADAALERAQAAAALELISIDLREALAELAELIGETTHEDVLTRLFQNFCIGK